MKNLLTTLFLLIPLVVLGHGKQDSTLFTGKFTNGISYTKADLIIGYFTPSVVICFTKTGKPVAKSPYMVFKRHGALIIFKNGKKVGAFTQFKKPFELTGLKLN